MKKIDVDCLYKGGTILTGNPAEPAIYDGAIAVSDGVIRILGPTVKVEKQIGSVGQIFDFGGLTLVPGLIDSHTHLFQTIGKTLGDGLALLPWLAKYMLPLAANMTQVDAVRIARLASLQSLKSGTTSVIDNHYAPVDAETILRVAETIEEVGLRGAVARGIFGPMVEGGRRMECDPRLFRYSVNEEVEITKECIAQRPSGSQVEVWPMPENIVYVDPELVIACHELAVEEDLVWQAHCSESRFEVEIFESIHKVKPAIWMEKAGILSDRTSLAHGIWFDDEEIAALGRAKATVVHNPVCNQYLASGIIKLSPLLEQGVNVALGTDGTAVGGQNMFESMKSGLILQKIREYDATSTNADMMFSLATENGGRALRKNTGRLAVGAKADFVMVDMSGLHHAPATNPVTGLVLSTQGQDVRHVIVGGDVVIKDGKSTRVDEQKVISEALEATKDMVKRANLGNLVNA